MSKNCFINFEHMLCTRAKSREKIGGSQCK